MKEQKPNEAILTFLGFAILGMEVVHQLAKKHYASKKNSLLLQIAAGIFIVVSMFSFALNIYIYAKLHEKNKTEQVMPFDTTKNK